MKEIFGNREGSVVGHYQSILKQAGIPSFIRNENAAALTELQGPAFYPVLCVDDEHYEVAMEILRPIYEAHLTQAPAADWVCPQCAEAVPGSFEICWNCEQARESVAPVS